MDGYLIFNPKHRLAGQPIQDLCTCSKMPHSRNETFLKRSSTGIPLMPVLLLKYHRKLLLLSTLVQSRRKLNSTELSIQWLCSTLCLWLCAYISSGRHFFKWEYTRLAFIEAERENFTYILICALFNFKLFLVSICYHSLLEYLNPFSHLLGTVKSIIRLNVDYNRK